MQRRDIVVIGGSAGSFKPLKEIVSGLPRDFPGTLFVVVHLPPDFPSFLDQQISQWGPLPATQAVDGDPVRAGHIYTACPDHHLTIERGRVRVLRGPRENRHRPAIDPLFRTAARAYGPRVVGIILSGMHDDGSAGMYAVKQLGGLAIVQDPTEAKFEEMPRSALEYANPQYVLRARDIAPLLVQLVQSSLNEAAMAHVSSGRQTGRKHPQQAKKSGGRNGSKSELEQDEVEQNMEVAYSEEGAGKPSVFACPECHGVLWELKEKKLTRYRCRVGHSYTTESLGQELSQSSETALWAAVRALEEKAAMQRRIADSLSSERGTARRLRDQSTADDANARVVRDMIFQRDAELEAEKRSPKAHSKVA